MRLAGWPVNNNERGNLTDNKSQFDPRGKDGGRGEVRADKAI